MIYNFLSTYLNYYLIYNLKLLIRRRTSLLLQSKSLVEAVIRRRRDNPRQLIICDVKQMCFSYFQKSLAVVTVCMRTDRSFHVRVTATPNMVEANCVLNRRILSAEGKQTNFSWTESPGQNVSQT